MNCHTGIQYGNPSITNITKAIFSFSLNEMAHFLSKENQSTATWDGSLSLPQGRNGGPL